MTDNEIIKALECCLDCKCKECPCYKSIDGEMRCIEIDEEEILDLINRQKAEVEKLTVNMNAFGLGMKIEAEKAEKAQAEIERLNLENLQMVASIKNLKAEAIKEFWEKLKTEARLRNHTNYGKNELAAAHNEGVIIARKHTLVCGDNLVKEMVGDAE